MKFSRKVFAVLSLFFLLTGSVFLSKVFNSLSNQIVIGAKNDTENQILSEMIAILIEKKSDLTVKRKFHLEGTFLCFEALVSGDIDLYSEYTGTAYFSILKQEDPHFSISDIREEFLKRYQIVWLTPFLFCDGYTLIADKQFAKSNQLRTLSDLSTILTKKTVRMGFETEFIGRKEFELMNNFYHLTDLANSYFLRMDQSFLFYALSHRDLDICIASETDGRIDDSTMILLEDDKSAFPSYQCTPIIRKQILEKYPFLEPLIQKLAAIVTVDKIKKLNFEAEINRKTPYNLAKDFLIQEGLL